jgi:hypothetical protein
MIDLIDNSVQLFNPSAMIHSLDLVTLVTELAQIPDGFQALIHSYDCTVQVLYTYFIYSWRLDAIINANVVVIRDEPSRWFRGRMTQNLNNGPLRKGESLHSCY